MKKLKKITKEDVGFLTLFGLVAASYTGFILAVYAWFLMLAGA